MWKIAAWVVGISLFGWGLFAGIRYMADTPAREYAAAGTSTEVSSRPDQTSPWLYFWFGYLLGGNNSYSTYRESTNSSYYGSPQYQESVRTVPSGNWGTDAPSADSGSDWAWSSGDSGSWGSDWSSSDDSGSWGGSASSWDMGGSDSGSWGGSDSSWSSDSSGSWGD